MRGSWFVRVNGAGVAVVLAVLSSASCKSVPVAPAATPAAAPAPIVPVDTKVAWLLRLEQQRVLRDPGVAAPTLNASRTLAPAATADLVALSLDPDAGLRRRAAVAIGRVGQAAGLPALTNALTDTDADVRAAAAFAIGELGSPEGAGALEAALKDASALVHARAADGLGLLGQASSAPAIADAASTCGGQIAAIAPDDEEWPKTPEIEACRASIFALVRLRQFDPLAKVVLDASGQPLSRWWPVAYALQRINDKRAVPALLALASTDGVITRAFAVRGLGAAGEAKAAPIAQGIIGQASTDVRLRVAAIQTLGQVGGADAVAPLMALVNDRATPPNLTLEAVNALGRLKDPRAFDLLIDLLTDPWPAMRAAATSAAAACDPDHFMLVIASFDRDKDWSVRAALATTLATLPADRVRSAIADLADDQDVRARVPALEALAKVGAPDLGTRLFTALEAPDFAVRATAAELIGRQKIDGGAEKLVAAYARGDSDATGEARLAAITALARYGADAAKPTLQKALGDKEWPVRVQAASLLKTLGDAGADPVRPAPLRDPVEFFQSDALLHPSFSPHAFIETKRGTIELELDVVNAPMTTHAFVTLARAGFFNGVKVHRLVPNFVVQAGDPRGDGEGGPGFSIRDEFSPLPFVRGTIGMALGGPETGGSQFFIALSPQPHLDGKYTVFGKVVRGGEILDAISQWDVIERIRIWDGVSFQ